MTGVIATIPRIQFFDSLGMPLAGGKMYTYVAGSTTPVDTFQDQALTSKNENPIPLDSSGSCAIWLDPNNSYKFVLKSAKGVIQPGWPIDNVSGASNLIALEPTLGQYAKLDALADGEGPALIGFLQDGIGAVPRTILDELRETVKVTQFGAKGDGVTDDTAAFTAAIAAADVVNIPPGNYLISSIKIDKNNFTLRGAGYGRSILTMTTAAKPAIEVASDSSVSGLVLANFKIEGTATNLGGIKLGTATNYVAIASLEDLFIDGFSNAGAGYGYGVQLCSVQEVNIHNVWAQYNKNALHRSNLGYCTSTKISGKNTYLGHSTNNGVLIEGQCDDIYICDGIIEGNAKEAVVVTNTAVNGTRGTRIWLKELYFEANLDGGSGQAVNWIVGGSGAYQAHRLVMENCEFASNPNAPAGTKNLKLDYTVAHVAKNVLIPADVQTTATCSVRFDSNRYPNASNYLVGYRSLLGVITATDFTDPATSSDLNQINLVNALSFPAVKRPVADRHTLDCFEKGVNNEYVPVAAGFGGSITGVTGRYVKVGPVVHFSIVLTGTNVVSTWLTSGVTLPFTTGAPGCVHMFNGATGLSLGEAYIDSSTDRVLTPTWASIPSATIVISGSYFADQ